MKKGNKTQELSKIVQPPKLHHNLTEVLGNFIITKDKFSKSTECINKIFFLSGMAGTYFYEKLQHRGYDSNQRDLRRRAYQWDENNCESGSKSSLQRCRAMLAPSIAMHLLVHCFSNVVRRFLWRMLITCSLKSNSSV